MTMTTTTTEFANQRQIYSALVAGAHIANVNHPEGEWLALSEDGTLINGVNGREVLVNFSQPGNWYTVKPAMRTRPISDWNDWHDTLATGGNIALTGWANGVWIALDDAGEFVNERGGSVALEPADIFNSDPSDWVEVLPNDND